MLRFRDFALRRGEHLLLSGMDLSLPTGARVGLVGRNGSGKSSLFAALLGLVEADQGHIDMSPGWRIAHVAQEFQSLQLPTLEAVIEGDRALFLARQAEQAAQANEDWAAVAEAHQALEDLGGYDAESRAARLLVGLGFEADQHQRPVSEFSGGWRMRIALARALMAPSDLLLLDEPTNHLDLDAVVWLEDWLKSYLGTLMVISHDREFLDNVAEHIVHIANGGAKLYAGNYQQFVRQRAEQLRQQNIQHQRQEAERARLQAFVDRFKAKASKAKQAQSRVKRLEKLEGTEAVRAERSIHIEFAQPVKAPQTLVRLDEADAGYGDDLVVLNNIRLPLQSGDRIGLLGKNGAGKSTLVKTIVGDLPLLAGQRTAHKDLVVGYFTQHTVDTLQYGHSPMQHMQQLAPDDVVQTLRDHLGRWQFQGDRAFETVDHFSGGEKARLALALIAYTRPNLLLLDEPTNHLDLEMREVLAEALSDFEGAIVLVSHDRHLMGLVCEDYWRVHDGAVEPFSGDLDDYAVWLRAQSKPSSGLNDEKKTDASPKQKASKPKTKRANPKFVEKKERELETLSEQLDAVNAALSDPALYDHDDVASRLAELNAQQQALSEQVEALEAELLELYERG